MISYVISSTQRSGSTMFCKVLESVGCFGKPDERLLFLERSEDKLNGRPLELKRMDFRSALCGAFEDASNGSHIRGVKLMASTLRRFPSNNGSSGVSNISDNQFLKFTCSMLKECAGVKRFVYWRRRDKLKQALSHFYLRKLGVAHIYNDRDAELYRQKMNSLVVSASDIEKEIFRIKEDECLWDRFFLLNGIDPLVIYYEDFLTDKPLHLDRFSSWLGTEGLDFGGSSFEGSVRIRKISKDEENSPLDSLARELREKYTESFEELFFW